MTALYSIAIIILSMLVLCLWCCLVAASDADDRAKPSWPAGRNGLSS